MKLSINATRFLNQHYGSAGDPAPSGVDDLVNKIGAQLGAVEEVANFGARFDGAVVAKIVHCGPHPNSDHLHVCMIDDGQKTPGVERDEQGLVQVVCGAFNARAGLMVVWLPPGVTVPETFEKSPLVLETRPIRGVASNGMLASARELTLGDDHEGILEITDHIEPGTSFAEAYRLSGDVIIDIENKMFTHRPDCFGWLGLARELEGIQHRPYKSPSWYVTEPEFPKPTQKLELEVKNEIPELVPRFTAIAISGVKVGPSPVWLQADLARGGLRSINNIVDYTNFYMLLTGQPIHAYDYDKVKALGGHNHARLVVRHPKKGETIKLLNGKTIEPRTDSMMVVTGSELLCVGGAMGGANSEVDQNTTNIILEAATWDMFNLRRTSMAHGIFSDAVTRFTKGQSPLQNLAALWKISDQICRFAGGEIASPVMDDNHVPPAVLKRGSLHPPIKTTVAFINQRLGADFTAAQITKLLQNVEFTVEHAGHDLTITAPFWRTDIAIAEDVVEEVGRLYGYDTLPQALPTRATSAVKLSASGAFKQTVRTILAAAGANELQTYSFVPAKLLENVGQAKVHAFSLRNAISPELEHYRLSITPSLLEKVHPNIKAGFTNHALFEMGKVHIKGDQDCDGLPREYQTLAFVLAANDAPAGAGFYQAKHYLSHLLDSLHVPFEIKPASHMPEWEIGRQVFAPFEPKRAGFVFVGGEFAGFIGEYHARARKNLKLPALAAGFEIDLERLMKHQQASSYQPLGRFPATGQDLCLKVKDDVTYGELEQLLLAELGAHENVRITTAPLDIYKREHDKTHKQITFRITLQHADRTLTTDEVNQIIEATVKKISANIGAERI